MILFLAGKRHGAGSTPGSYSETTSPVSQMRRASSACARRVVPVDAATEHGDRASTAVQRSAVCLAVDSARQTAHDDEPGSRELARERAGHRATVRGAGTRADDRHGRELEQSSVRRLPADTAAAADRGSLRAAPETRPHGAGCASSHVPVESPGVRYEAPPRRASAPPRLPARALRSSARRGPHVPARGLRAGGGRRRSKGAPRQVRSAGASTRVSARARLEHPVA